MSNTNETNTAAPGLPELLARITSNAIAADANRMPALANCLRDARDALAAQPAPGVGGVSELLEQLRGELAEDKGWDYTEYERGRLAEKERVISQLAALVTRPAKSVAQGGEADMADAYHGAMEDKDDWKRQAQTAHAILRTLGYTGIVPTEPPKPVGYTNWASVKATDSGFVCMREWQAGFFTIPLLARIDT